MHKDIKAYKPKVAFGLSMRMIISIVCAIGISVFIGIYFTFVLGLSIDTALIFVYLTCIPCWCIGFIRPKGMPFEQFLPLFLRHQLQNNKVLYVSNAAKTHASASRRNLKCEDKEYSKFRKIKGVERYESGNE
jgi:hypothetical protein